MNAKSKAARLPDKRLAEIRDELERLVQFDIHAASPYKPRLTLALIAELQERRAADACEAERTDDMQKAVDNTVARLDALADEWEDGVSPECTAFAELLRAELVLLRSWATWL